MCIVNTSNSINVKIGKTRIVTGHDGIRQFVIYDVDIDLELPEIMCESNTPTNAIIIPIPASNKKEINVYPDLKTHDFFDICEFSFSRTETFSFETSPKFVDTRPCEPYQYAIVDNLTNTDFVFNPRLIEEFNSRWVDEGVYYLILRIVPGMKYNPIVYSHPLPATQELVIPTFRMSSNGKDIFVPDISLNWNHEIYSFGVSLKNLEAASQQIDKKSNKFQSSNLSVISLFKALNMKIDVSTIYKWMNKGSGKNQFLFSKKIPEEVCSSKLDKTPRICPACSKEESFKQEVVSDGDEEQIIWIHICGYKFFHTPHQCPRCGVDNFAKTEWIEDDLTGERRRLSKCFNCDHQWLHNPLLSFKITKSLTPISASPSPRFKTRPPTPFYGGSTLNI